QGGRGTPSQGGSVPGPASPRRSVCAPGDGLAIVPRTKPEKETCSMPLMQLLIDRLDLSCRTPDKASRRAPERRVRPLRRSARPCLERLEGRCVPSTLRVNHDFNVHAAADLTAKHGTLAWAVANAQNGDTIFLTGDVEQTGITLTQGELILTQQNL